MEVAEAGGEVITDTGSLLENGKASEAKELGNHWRKCFFLFYVNIHNILQTRF